MTTATVAFEIGGARLRAESTAPDLDDLVLALAPAARPFQCPPHPADVVTSVNREAIERTPKGRLIFRSGGLWDLWDSDGEYRFRFISPLMGPTPYKVAVFDRHFQRGRMAIHTGYPAYAPAGQPFDPHEYPLDELIVVHWLAQGRGLELHACGIVDHDGRGHLFVGHSGAGKTTLATLWPPGARVLSDDRIIVRFHEGRAWMYGTPWHGEARLSAPGRVPLSSLFLIKQADRAALSPLPPATAASRLLACSFVPFHSADALGFTLELLRDLVREVPCAELSFARDPGFVDLVRR